jgi:hypothetical protein
MDGKVFWTIIVVGALVIGACTTSQVIHSGEGESGYTPVPSIPHTEVAVPRAWQAPEGVETRAWKYIVIHHSASDFGGAMVFDSWHRQRGFDELGYHFVIDNGEGGEDGKVEVGSRWSKQKQGAHTKSADGKYNDQGIGICLVGNFEKTTPTPAQWAALVKLVAYLKRTYGIGETNIMGHRDANEKTLCPGKNVSIIKLRNDVRDVR